MKAINFITHPYTVIISFLMILISGEHLGSFYVIYLLLALPTGAVHSLSALAGIGILLFSYHKFHRQNLFIIEPVLNILGLCLLLLSIYVFFYTDKEHYNYGTFYQTIPLFTIIFTALTALCFLASSIWNLMRRTKHSRVSF